VEPAAPELIPLPVGFIAFHRQPFLNYQLNRVHGLGFADSTVLQQAAATLRS
jgi:hypothetical protein